MKRFATPVALAIVALFLAFLAAPTGWADEETDANRFRERLESTHTSLAVDEQTFSDVIRILRLQTGMNILIDPRIAMDVAESPITNVRVSDLPVTTVLDLLVPFAGEEVVWVVHGNTVLVTSRAFVGAKLEARIYPIQAFVGGQQLFLPQDDSLFGSVEDEEDQPEPQYTRRFGTEDELVELIQNAVHPRFWEETEGASLRTMGRRLLIVNATAEIHAAIDAYLARLNALSSDAVMVDLRAIRLEQPIDSLDVLDDAVAARLLTAGPAGPAMRIAVRERLPSVVFLGRRQSLVTGYDAHPRGKVAKRDPVVEPVPEGLAAIVRAYPGPGGERILLDLSVVVARTGEVRTPGGFSTTRIQLAERGVARCQGFHALVPGRWHVTQGSAADEDGWAFLVRATPIRPAAPGAPAPATAMRVPTPRRLETAHALDATRVRDLSWENASLDRVIGYLRTETGTNFYITPRARVEVMDHVEVSLRLDDVSARTVLDLVTEPYELEWRVVNDVVTICVREDRFSQMALRYYDVNDICAKGEVDPLIDAEEIADLAREYVGFDYAWEDPASIGIKNGILIARNTPEVLDAVERLLHALRTSRPMIVTTIDTVRVPDNVLQEMTGRPAGLGLPAFLDVVAESDLAIFIQNGEAERTSHERIVTVDGMPGSRQTGEEVAYVRDQDVEMEPHGEASVILPVTDTLETGTRIRVRPAIGYPGDFVDVQLDADRTNLVAMADAFTTLGRVDLPTLDVRRVATGLRIPNGRTAVVFAGRDGGDWELVLVRASRVKLADD